MEQKKWGIIGGGIMGLTLAHQLSQQGYKVTIFEGAPPPPRLQRGVIG